MYDLELDSNLATFHSCFEILTFSPDLSSRYLFSGNRHFVSVKAIVVCEVFKISKINELLQLLDKNNLHKNFKKK